MTNLHDPVARAASGFAEVGARRLHYVTAGEASPTVVLEAGLTGSASEWRSIVPRLATTCRVVASSRAGYGESTPAPRRPARASVDDLEAVLDAAGATGPLVLVGHSWGGLLVRLLAARRPEQVAAVVLVDATHEGLAPMRRRRAELLGGMSTTLAGMLARSGLMARGVKAGKGDLGAVYARLDETARTELLVEITAPVRGGRRVATTAASHRCSASCTPRRLRSSTCRSSPCWGRAPSTAGPHRRAR